MTHPGPFADVHVGQIDRVSRKLSAVQIRDSAYTQIAVASVAYAEQRIALVRMLAAGRDHGLTLPELAEASGRPENFVAGLLEEA